MINIEKFLREVFNKLDYNKIKYMVSGSVASNFYCVPRMTRDVDIVIELPEIKIDEFVKLFPDSYVNIDTVRYEVSRKGMFNVIDNETGFKIDFIIRKDIKYVRMWCEKLNLKTFGLLENE